MNFIIEWLNIDQLLKLLQVTLSLSLILLDDLSIWIYRLVQARITSSSRQRLRRYRELRSRTPTVHKTPPETTVTSEAPTETTEGAYIMINSQEILRLIEVRERNQICVLKNSHNGCVIMNEPLRSLLVFHTFVRV